MEEDHVSSDEFNGGSDRPHFSAEIGLEHAAQPAMSPRARS